MSRLLAIDSATEFCSVAYTDGSVLLSRGEELPRQHSQQLLPYVNDMLDEAGVRLSDLDAIVVSQGPGSFTGVRIGVSIAQGLAFSQNLPLVPVSTLAAMAQACYELEGATQVLSAIDARMGEVYWGTYHLTDGLMVKMADECVCAPEEVSAPEDFVPENTTDSWMTCGTGFETYAAALAEALKRRQPQLTLTASQQVRLPHARFMLTLGAAALADGQAVAAEELSPQYLRNEVTWQKLPGR